jgi:hypothetical protein
MIFSSQAAPAWRRIIITAMILAAPAAARTDAQGAPPQAEQVEVETQIVEITQNASDEPRKTLLQPFATDTSLKPDENPGSDAGIIGQLTKGADGSLNLNSQMALLGVFTEAQHQAVMRAISQKAGCKVLSAPSITVKSGEEGTIAVTQKFSYPTEYQPAMDSPSGFSPAQFKSRDVGETEDVKATVGPDGETIDFETTGESTGLLGFLVEKNGDTTLEPLPKEATEPVYDKPVFCTTGNGKKIDISIWDGQTVLISGTKLEMQAGADGGKPEIARKSVLMLITAKLVNADKSLVHDDQEKEEDVQPLVLPTLGPREQAAESKLPDAVPVPGKPGYVTSPYAPDAGIVDVRGYTKGTEVRDPYTGKMFFVP